MGYLHISNLYKPEAQKILLFKRCYALEKIHGTSAHIQFIPNALITNDSSCDLLGASFTLFSGGEKHLNFVALFDRTKLEEGFKACGLPVDRKTTIYGEAYGGKQQDMSDTYGKQLKFIVFDVQVGDNWLDVPNAEKIANKLGLEFVHYVEISTDLADIDEQRDADSVQAIRNGVGAGKKREGVVLRPLFEVKLNNDERLMAKHKRDDFGETKTPRAVDPNQLQILTDAKAIAEEWCVPNRLQHILQKFPADIGMEKTREVIYAMVEDVLREAAGEIVPSDAVNKAIGQKTVQLFKEHLKSKLVEASNV